MDGFLSSCLLQLEVALARACFSNQSAVQIQKFKLVVGERFAWFGCLGSLATVVVERMSGDVVPFPRQS